DDVWRVIFRPHSPDGPENPRPPKAYSQEKESPMPEKSAAATQSAPSRLPVKTAKTEDPVERTDLFDAISRRAYELFELEDRIDGNHTRHWLEAEGGLL